MLSKLPIPGEALVKFCQFFGREWNAGKQDRGTVKIRTLVQEGMGKWRAHQHQQWLQEVSTLHDNVRDAKCIILKEWKGWTNVILFLREWECGRTEGIAQGSWCYSFLPQGCSGILSGLWSQDETRVSHLCKFSQVELLLDSSSFLFPFRIRF